MMFLGLRVYEYYGIPLELYQKRKYAKKNQRYWNGKRVNNNINNNIGDNDNGDNDDGDSDDPEREATESDEEYNCDYDNEAEEQKKGESSDDESDHAGEIVRESEECEYDNEAGYISAELKANDYNFVAHNTRINNESQFDMDIEHSSSDDDENRPIIDVSPPFTGSVFDMD